jgi:streptogramin lyase
MTALAGTTLATTGLFVGGPSNYFNGTVSELLLFSNALSFAQRQSVEGYLASKWGLRTLMPLIHPFYSLRPSNRGFSPLDIPGCALWLDGADLSSMTLSGINVTQWSDKSGSGNHATGGVSPTYSSSAGAVLFNGTSSYLQTSLSAVPTVETVFAVFRASILPTQTDAGAVIFGATGSGGRGFVVITNATSGSTAYQLRYDAYAVGNIALTPYGGVIYNTLTLATAQYTGGQGAGSTNGSSFGSFQSLSFSGSTTTRIGAVSGGGFFNGTINEILIYNTALAAPQRQQIEGYLAAKWGLRGSIPGIASSPLDIPGCRLWLDGNDVNGNGVQPTNGASVSSWKDKSGLGYHAVGNLGTGTYSSNGFAGYPTIQITQSGNMKAPVPAGTFSNAVSAFIVWQKTGGSTGCDALVSRGLGGSGGPFDMYSYTSFGNSPKIIGNGTTGSAYYDTITFFRNPNPNIFFFNIASNASTTWNESLNGSYRTLTTSEGTAAYGDAGSNIFIGTRADGFSTMIGNISEIIFYNFSLSTTQRQSIEAYLVAKWGITATVGTAHPYKTLPPTTSQPAQYSEVSPGNWTHDWQPYLRALTRANAGATASFSSNSVTGAAPGSSAYMGGVLAPNGKIYCIPYGARNIGVINPNTNTFNYNSVVGTVPAVNSIFWGGVLAPNGKIYCIPCNGTSVGVIDPDAETFSSTTVTGTITGTGAGAFAYLGGVLAPNGKIYCIPCNATNVGVIDPIANTFTTFGTAPGGTAYQAGCLGANGKIYCIPYSSTTVGVIDPIANTFTTFGTAPGGGAYTGGVLAPNGKIYCIPTNATSIGVIDTTVSPNTFTTFGTSSVNFYGATLSSDGKVYYISNNGSSLSVIDPNLNSVTTVNGVTIASNYFSMTLAPNGKIYCIPFSATTVGVISFSGVSQTPSLNYCLSAYANKF